MSAHLTTVHRIFECLVHVYCQKVSCSSLSGTSNVDPESFVRGGPIVTFFVYIFSRGGRKDPIPL